MKQNYLKQFLSLNKKAMVMGLIQVLFTLLLFCSVFSASGQGALELTPEQESLPVSMDADGGFIDSGLEVHTDAKSNMLTIHHTFVQHTALIVQFTDESGRQIRPQESRILNPNKKKVDLNITSWPEEPCFLKVLAGKLQLSKFLD